MIADVQALEAAREFAKSDSEAAKAIRSEMEACISDLLDIRSVDTNGGKLALRLLAHKAAADRLIELFMRLGFDVDPSAVTPHIERSAPKNARGSKSFR